MSKTRVEANCFIILNPKTCILKYVGWDRGGIVVVHQTTNREVLSSIRTGDTVLCP